MNEDVASGQDDDPQPLTEALPHEDDHNDEIPGSSAKAIQVDEVSNYSNQDIRAVNIQAGYLEIDEN